MFLGRFFMMIPMLAVAGSVTRKKDPPGRRRDLSGRGASVCRTSDRRDFARGALTFFPALSLGPIVEHFEMLSGHVFP